jgi:hypothetical protein
MTANKTPANFGAWTKADTKAYIFSLDNRDIIEGETHGDDVTEGPNQVS